MSNSYYDKNRNDHIYPRTTREAFGWDIDNDVHELNKEQPHTTTYILLGIGVVTLIILCCI